MGPILTLLVIYVVLGLLGIALFLGWAILLGSLLMHLVPSFSLFEASLLVSIATLAVGYVLSRILSSFPRFDFEDEDAVSSLPLVEIPPSRFYKNPSEKTWEAWLCYYLANEILYLLEKAPRVADAMEKPQRQELAIRMAEIGVARLKRKSTRAKRLKVTADELKQQMTAMGLKPYDDDLLHVAVSACNMALLQPEIDRGVRGKHWQKLTDHFDA